jgi:hypothetical protein
MTAHGRTTTLVSVAWLCALWVASVRSGLLCQAFTTPQQQRTTSSLIAYPPTARLQRRHHFALGATTLPRKNEEPPASSTATAASSSSEPFQTKAASSSSSSTNKIALDTAIPYPNLTIGVWKETYPPSENRVAQSPDSVASLVAAGFSVVVQAGGTYGIYSVILGVILWFCGDVVCVCVCVCVCMRIPSLYICVCRVCATSRGKRAWTSVLSLCGRCWFAVLPLARVIVDALDFSLILGTIPLYGLEP